MSSTLNPAPNPAQPLLEVQDLHIATVPAAAATAAAPTAATTATGAPYGMAVRGLSFSLRRGEVLCLVGESGAGKSAIALGLMGLLPPGLAVTGGRVVLQGVDITQAPASRLRALRGRRLAWLGPDPMTALNPAMRCGAQLAQVLAGRPHAQMQTQALHLAREVGLADPERLLACRPHALTAGQRQRLLLAMALAQDPVLLIADAPDPLLDGAPLLALLRDLQKRRGFGLLCLTRDFGVAAELAQRVAVLREGEMLEIGSKDEVLLRPQHDYTRALLRAAPTLRQPDRAAEPTSLPVLRVKGLCKAHAGRPAIDDLTLEVRRSQTLAVVGESGSGKTTLARCILRLTEPDRGTVLLGADDITGLSPGALRAQRRRMQTIGPDPALALNPWRTVGQALVEGPVNYGLHPDDAYRRARDLLALVRMDRNALERAPHGFSAAEQQRICIARALMLEPEVLVADEPFASLDFSQQAPLLALLAEVGSRMHLALIFLTRDLRSAAALSDRIAVLSAGRIVETGPARQLLQAPQHATTRALLAAVPAGGAAFGG